MFKTPNALNADGTPNRVLTNNQSEKEAGDSGNTPVQRPTMRLRLCDVIVFLKKQGYPLEATLVSYYSAVFSAFINCNSDPISKKVWLTEDDLELFDDVLSLRLKFIRSISR
jgi:hypothetical protein